MSVLDLGPCEMWKDGADPDKYGQVRHNGRVEYTHRVAYETEHGPIPEGCCVLHRCDVPACKRPSHLYLGTHADNVSDMVAKERQCRGECGSARTSDRRRRGGDLRCARRMRDTDLDR